jgi:tight adherence protein B
MKRLVLAALPLVAVAALLAAGASAQGQPTLLEIAGAHFPDRSYMLTLPPGTVVSPDQLRVAESGREVVGLKVVAAEETNKTFGVVLAIDTSRSMQGPALDGAMSAARAFAAQRKPNQRLGVILFDREVRTLLPPTTDQASIDAALATSPATLGGTRMYDGVAGALQLLKDAKVDAGAVVLLSDGADTASEILPTALVAQANAAHARLYAVGLRSRRFQAGPLRTLATSGGGDYSEATSPSDLAKIYDSLGAQLANQYVLRYRSLAGPGQRIEVEVTIAGVEGTAASGYETPKLTLAPTPAYHPSLAFRFWGSALAMLGAALLSAALVGGALMVLLRPRRRSLRSRMAEFVSIYLPERREKSSPLPEKVFVGAERSLARAPWWARFKQDVALAGLRIPPVQLVLWTLVATMGVVWLLKLIFGSVLLALAALAIPFGVRMFIRRRVDQVRNRFAEQLPDNLQVLASALRAGHSLVGALSVVVDDAPEPSRSEFRRVVADEQLGVPLDQSLTVVARRMDNRDLDQVALVATLQRDTGGNTAEVLDRVTDTVRARFELRRLVKTLTAQGRMSRWVVSLLPVGLFGVITLMNSAYLRPLYTHTSGRILLLISAIMIISGSLVIRRIVNFKV